MDLPWGDPRTHKFVTNVGMITSHGPNGDNIMAAEWTHHVSYSPGYIAVCLREDHATAENIKVTKEFGVNLAAQDQGWVSSVAGGSSGHQVDKVAALKALGVKFHTGNKIKAMMITGAAMNAECKLIQTVKLGDHTMYVGEVVEATAGDKPPAIFHSGKYWHFGEAISKPAQNFLDKVAQAVEKNKKE